MREVFESIINKKSSTEELLYSYKKNPNDKHQLIIDQEVKGIIETIFNKKVDGYSSSSIAKYLNELGIVTPARHREKKLGDSVGFVGKDKKVISESI